MPGDLQRGDDPTSGGPSDFASLWWEASGFKHGKRQVRNMEQALLELQQGIYATQPCHSVVIHLPNVDVVPLPVMRGRVAGGRATRDPSCASWCTPTSPRRSRRRWSSR